jgi:hypothetical protein
MLVFGGAFEVDVSACEKSRLWQRCVAIEERRPKRNRQPEEGSRYGASGPSSSWC